MATDAIGLALSGLDVTRARIDTLSRNISNAQTEGYNNKVQGQTVGNLGQVELGSIQRNVDEQLLDQFRSTSANVNQLNVSVGLLSQIETSFGTPASDSSLSAAITNLQNAFQDLSVNPEQGSLYNSVITAATTVARSLNSLSQTVSSTSSDAAAQVQNAVSSVNQALTNLDTINKEIVASGTAADNSDLEDQRDRLITTIAGFMNITTFKRPDGAIAVYTTDGKPLVDYTVASLSTVGTSILWNSPPDTPSPVPISTGTLGGLQTLQNVTLPGIQSQLDDIARALTVEFNNINIPIFNDGGSTPLHGTNPALPISPTNPVDPVQLHGYARRIAVNQTIIATPTLIRDGNSPTPLAPGDTTNINQALALFNRQNIAFNAATGLPASGSLIQVTTSFISSQSALRANAQTSLDSAISLQQTLKNQLSAKSGVNVDDQVAQLTVLQNTYSANARVLQTSKDLFSTLFNAV